MRKTINIRPTTSVYATYSRLSYQPWTAIAEFVDNSTQSFFDHESLLNQKANIGQLSIEINYETDNTKGDILTVKDNAFGMELDDLERAVVLDRPPKTKNGRNEFGMGLKTAACWLGKIWSIRTTQYGSDKEYFVEIDVNKLVEDKPEEVTIATKTVSSLEHYTIIQIQRLNKRLTGGRTIGKIKELLASTYRQDIRKGNVRITYKGDELNFTEVSPYQENGKEWKEEVDFSIATEYGDLQVKGFVAIRIPGSLKDAGLTLFRRGRVIIGGPEKNYRPLELFGDTNSFSYQRIYGELHMDNWPVTQAKDDFDWHSEGLEETFIKELGKYIKPLKAKADSIRVRTTSRMNPVDIITTATQEVSKTGDIESGHSSIASTQFVTDENIDISSDINATNNSINILNNTGNDSIQSPQETSNILPQEIIHWQYEHDGNILNFDIQLDIDNTHGDWLSVSKLGNNHYKLRLNGVHPFFKPFVDDAHFIKIMLKFVIAMVLSECDAMKVAVDGRIEPGDIRNGMNKYLDKLSQGNLQ